MSSSKPSSDPSPMYGSDLAESVGEPKVCVEASSALLVYKGGGLEGPVMDSTDGDPGRAGKPFSRSPTIRARAYVSRGKPGSSRSNWIPGESSISGRLTKDSCNRVGFVGVKGLRIDVDVGDGKVKFVEELGEKSVVVESEFL